MISGTLPVPGRCLSSYWYALFFTWPLSCPSRASLEKAILLPQPAYMPCQKGQSPGQGRGIGEEAHQSMLLVALRQSSRQGAHRKPALAWRARSAAATAKLLSGDTVPRNTRTAQD